MEEKSHLRQFSGGQVRQGFQESAVFWKTMPIGDLEEMSNSRTFTAIIFNKNRNVKTLIKLKRSFLALCIAVTEPFTALAYVRHK